MKKEYNIYTEEEWNIKGHPKECYTIIETTFDIICSKCGSKSKLYQSRNGSYDTQPIIYCSKCENEQELYGCDG